MCEAHALTDIVLQMLALWPQSQHNVTHFEQQIQKWLDQIQLTLHTPHHEIFLCDCKIVQCLRMAAVDRIDFLQTRILAMHILQIRQHILVAACLRIRCILLRHKQQNVDHFLDFVCVQHTITIDVEYFEADCNSELKSMSIIQYNNNN